MKPTRTWILVTDGGHARILEALGRGKNVHVFSEANLNNTPSHLKFRDRVVRVHESLGYTRHSLEPRQDLHRALEVLFASQLGAMLGGYAASNSFDRLVVVAPPTMLGQLRKVLPSNTREKIVAEIDKDLTRFRVSEVVSRIQKVAML